MVEVFICIAWTIIFIIVCKYLSVLFYRVSTHLDEKEKRKQYLESTLHEAIIDIRDSVASPKEGKVNYLEQLLEANSQIQEKNRLRNAIENELGIM